MIFSDCTLSYPGFDHKNSLKTKIFYMTRFVRRPLDIWHTGGYNGENGEGSAVYEEGRKRVSCVQNDLRGPAEEDHRGGLSDRHKTAVEAVRGGGLQRQRHHRGARLRSALRRGLRGIPGTERFFRRLSPEGQLSRAGRPASGEEDIRSRGDRPDGRGGAVLSPFRVRENGAPGADGIREHPVPQIPGRRADASEADHRRLSGPKPRDPGRSREHRGGLRRGIPLYPDPHDPGPGPRVRRGESLLREDPVHLPGLGPDLPGAETGSQRHRQRGAGRDRRRRAPHHALPELSQHGHGHGGETA